MKVETIGKSDEDRELVVVWVSSDENIKNLQQNREQPREDRRSARAVAGQIRQLIATTKPHYHLMGGLHSGETGPSEMLMELVYRLATETSPLIRQIRDNVIVSVTPWPIPTAGIATSTGSIAARSTGTQAAARAVRRHSAPAAGGGRRTRRRAPVPYWGKYVFHDNNRDINLSQVSMRAIADWYFTRATRRSCTTCTSRCRCSIPTAARRRRTRTSIRSCSRSCRSSPTSSWRR